MFKALPKDHDMIYTLDLSKISRDILKTAKKKHEHCIRKVVMRCSLYLDGNPFEPVHEKTNNLGFRPGLTQTRLHSHRGRLEA